MSAATGESDVRPAPRRIMIRREYVTIPVAIARPPKKKSISTLVALKGPSGTAAGKGETRTKTPITLAMAFWPRLKAAKAPTRRSPARVHASTSRRWILSRGIAARVSRKRPAAKRPERAGLTSQDERSVVSAVRSVGRPVKRFQPTIAPTIDWEMETGRPILVRSSTMARPAASATTKAPAGASMAPRRPRVTLVPWAPAMAPITTKTAATPAAVRKRTIFVPTAVPKMFAPSLAPRDHPRKRPLDRKSQLNARPPVRESA